MKDRLIPHDVLTAFAIRAVKRGGVFEEQVRDEDSGNFVTRRVKVNKRIRGKRGLRHTLYYVEQGPTWSPVLTPMEDYRRGSKKKRFWRRERRFSLVFGSKK